MSAKSRKGNGANADGKAEATAAPTSADLDKLTPEKYAELAKAVEQLSPEQAAYFLFQIEVKLRSRKIQLTGYLVGVAVWLVGMFFALVYFGLAEGFAGWIFLVPFALFGVILYGFGRWANTVAQMKPPPEIEIKR